LLGFIINGPLDTTNLAPGTEIQAVVACRMADLMNGVIQLGPRVASLYDEKIIFRKTLLRFPLT
jgi:hypothetical protein